MADTLPSDIVQGATLRAKEYGWTIALFPEALARAEAHGYACLGGQFQFRLDDGSTCEMYWLSADSEERVSGESWADYSQRSCSEVLDGFQHLVSTADFKREALSWPSVRIEATKDLVFVADFVTEADLDELSKNLS